MGALIKSRSLALFSDHVRHEWTHNLNLAYPRKYKASSSLFLIWICNIFSDIFLHFSEFRFEVGRVIHHQAILEEIIQLTSPSNSRL
jgi:hypothetical protein